MNAAPSSALSDRFGGDWTMTPLAQGFCATWRARRDPAAARSSEDLFVKTLPLARAPVLQAEVDGLAALSAAGGIRVPAVAGCWVDPARDLALLALEWLALSSAPAPRFGERLAQRLAALHGMPPAEGDGRFGWRRDNWLGGTPQRNRWSAQGGLAGWLAFLADERLGAMGERLSGHGADSALLEALRRLIAALPSFFDDGHVPRPSLVHGDLWSGNWGSLQGGVPVLYDPAVSVSDAEAELAMMELFGAPPPGFFPAYREAAGLAAGYARRRPLYQLYHLLNHALLFGGGYARQSLALMHGLLGRR